ncbi:MAG: copper chaperone PCu(A)C [Campylobacter sp.]
MKGKFFLLSLLIGTFSVYGADIEVSNIYAKATPPSAQNSAIFFEVKNNTDKVIKLISANSPASKTAELHTHQHIDGMMKMVQVDSIEIPANGETKLAPGGLHVMLIGIKNPMNEGDKIDATLEFDNGEKIELKDVVAKKVVKMDHKH